MPNDTMLMSRQPNLLTSGLISKPKRREKDLITDKRLSIRVVRCVRFRSLPNVSLALTWKREKNPVGRIGPADFRPSRLELFYEVVVQEAEDVLLGTDKNVLEHDRGKRHPTSSGFQVGPLSGPPKS